MNKFTAQYTKSKAIIPLVILACFEKSTVKSEPKPDQSTVHTKPMKASKNENPIRTGIFSP